MSRHDRRSRSDEQHFDPTVRFDEALAISGLKPTQLSEKIKSGEFPKPFKLSDSGRSVGWLLSELLNWRERRIAARDAEHYETNLGCDAP
jgi:predicted DNA-binding transcriptional regulator AlpA